MEGAEHAWIGDQITLTYAFRGNLPAKRFPLNIGSRHVLTYGQVIALGGDFYGVVGAPISTAPDSGQAFLNAWNSLVTAEDTEVKAILAIMNEEIVAVEQALAEGKEPSTVYHALGDNLSARWNRLTGGGSVVSDFFPPGRYLKLSSENWDHFNTFAVLAYTVGHDNAMYQARLAAEQPQDVQDIYLEEAYAMNAFADHFLTDLFSAGHVRSPRKALTDLLVNDLRAMAGAAGGLLTRSMHDEDGDHGLNVVNANKTHWKAYGDKKLLDTCSADNRKQVVAAVQASADDVWAAFRGRAHQRSALAYIPDLQAALSVSTGNNDSPLFRLDSTKPGQVYRRRDMANPEDFTWTNDWNPLDTLLELFGGHPYTKVKCFDPVSRESLGWLTKGGNNYLQLTDNEDGVHRCSWYVSGDSLYLRKETSGTINGRFLGVDGGEADWELGGSPVVYNPDGTISLKDDPTRRLCVGDSSWIYWTYDDAPKARLLALDLPLGPAITP